MSGFASLIDCSGEWSGTSCLRDPMNGVEDEGESSLLVVPVLGGRFARVDYTWSYHGRPQEGSMLVGRSGDRVSIHWIDSWHMGDKAMACEGDDGGNVSVRGSYAAPPGPDWGWRITLTPAAGSSFGLVMHNITPDGDEELAVEARYAPA